VNDMSVFQNEMNRLFEDYWGSNNETDVPLECSWRPNVDIVEKAEDFEIYVELPGISKEDVKLGVNDNILTIRGERKLPEHNGKEYHRQERCYGKFERNFTLSRDLDVEKIEANFKEGVLRIGIPKLEEAKPKEIEVKVK
jgi:HSP20 family protein